MAGFKLTYSTMFNPPEELHKGFDKAVAKLKANLGREYAMLIDGKDVLLQESHEVRHAFPLRGPIGEPHESGVDLDSDTPRSIPLRRQDDDSPVPRAQVIDNIILCGFSQLQHPFDHFWRCWYEGAKIGGRAELVYGVRESARGERQSHEQHDWRTLPALMVHWLRTPSTEWPTRTYA